MFDCLIAKTFPIVIVNADKISMIIGQLNAVAISSSPEKTLAIKRIKSASPAAFGAIEKNAVIGVGDP